MEQLRLYFHEEDVITYAHIPAGFIVCQLLIGRFKNRIQSYPLFFFWGLTGAILPDVDYLYQTFFDYQNYDHHYYFLHFPLFWSALLICSSAMVFLHKKKQTTTIAFMFSLNGFIHMILDSIEGRIFWLAPFSYKGYSASSLIRQRYPSFIDENPAWSSTVEAFIFFLALALFLKSIHKIQRQDSTI